MKSKNRLSPSVIITMLATSVGTLPAHAGAGSSGGGDSLAAHFAATAERVTTALTQKCEDSAWHSQNPVLCSQSRKFIQIVPRVQVLPRAKVMGPDGQPREAINDGVGTIELDTGFWQAVLSDSIRYEAGLRIIVHEYAQIARLEASDSYAFSARLLRSFKLARIEPLILLDLIPSPAEIEKNIAQGHGNGPFTDDQVRPAVAAECLFRYPGNITEASECTLTETPRTAKLLNMVRECREEGFPCKGTIAEKIRRDAFWMPCSSWANDTVLPPYYCRKEISSQDAFKQPLFDVAAGQPNAKLACSEHIWAQDRCWVE